MQPRALLVVLSFLFTIVSAQAQLVDSSPVVDLLGHYDQTNLVDPVPLYTKSSTNDTPNRFGMQAPRGIAFDTVNHRMFVSDAGNGRVLVYNLTTGNALVDRIPDFVLGKTGFEAGGGGRSQSLMDGPEGIAYDSANNRLFVSDTNNRRILVFDVSTITNGQNAINVLGQADFTANVNSTTANSVVSPGGLALDSSRNLLFATDGSSNRVMVFDVAAIADNENAVNVLGQSDYTTSSSATSQFRMTTPRAVAYDSTKQLLFVSEAGSHRISIFDVTNITDGQSAVNVLGQSNFTTAFASVSQAGLSTPLAIALNGTASRLFVSESGGNRVKVYDVVSIASGEASINVLGQNDFTSSAQATTRAGMNINDARAGLAYDPTTDLLYVGEAGNNRISVFEAASITNGEDAVDLLGQYDGTSLSAPVPSYTRGNADDAPNRLGMNGPYAVEVDTMHHRLFAADRSNNRVLVYNLTNDNVLVDHIPDFVLGQSDFISNSSTTTQTGMNLPRGLAYDATRNYLFVADSQNRRVVVYDVATITNGQAAIHVLGQSNYTTNTQSLSASGFNAANSIALNASGTRLFVSDSSYNRVMVFDVATIVDGAAAVNVLGQSGFTSSSGANGQNRLNNPDGLAYDGTGNRLFVVDYGNNRLMVYNASSLSNGQNAIGVLGQLNFTTSSPSTSQAKMDNPVGVAYDSANSVLFVSQTVSQRITTYDVASIVDGENAVNVLGQTNFTANSSGVSRTKLNGPRGLAFDGSTSRLYVADGGNNRIVAFPSASSVSYGSGTFTEAGANDGSIATTVTVSLLNDNFVVPNGPMTANTHYTVANVPAGLTAVVTGTSLTTATITFTGNASAHEEVDDISNFTIAFLDAAFALRTASLNSGSTKNDFVIDFASAPTPTPTNTPTHTPTFTATATQTATSVPTAAPTATNTAAGPTVTATPVSTQTATPTPESSATPAPTASPTPSPTTGATEVRGQVIVDGQPLAGALVYVEGLGSTLTDENGFFVIAGASAGTTYNLFVQRSGVRFPVGETSANAGTFVQLTGVSQPFNPRGCVASDISRALNKATGTASDLRSRVLVATKRLPKKNSDFVENVQTRLTNEMNAYIASSRAIPEVNLDCSGIAGCTNQKFTAEKKGMVEQLDNLRHEGLLVSRKLRLTSKKNQGSAAKLKQRLVRVNKAGTKLVKKLPGSSGVCP